MNNRYTVLGIVLTVMLGAMTVAQSASVVYTLYGPYGVGQATNLAGVSIGKVTGSYSNGTFYNAQVWLNESSTLYGPYSVKQATNIPNVSIGKVTATINSTNAIVNQQVWLNESSSTSSGKSYTFQTYIGSVLNGGITSNSLISTKSYQASYPYAFLDTSSITNEASPYSAVGIVPADQVPSSSTAGGISFTGIPFVSSNYDNIMQINSSEVPTLVTNYGPYGESEYLWLTGFPVYDQQPGVSNFQLMSAGGAYQIVFNKPPVLPTAPLNTSFQFFGKTVSVVSYSYPSTVVNKTSTAAGGELTIEYVNSSVKTIKKSANATYGNFTVRFDGPSYMNSNNITGGSFNIYYNNVLTNVTYAKIGSTATFNVSGNHFSFYVKSVTKSEARIQFYNEYTLENARVFDNNYGWDTVLLWSNPSGGTPVYLQSIIIYNQTPTNLLPGQSFSFATIVKGKHYSMSFIGDTAGSANYDPITISTSEATESYQNLGSGPTNVTEPAELLTVQSSIKNAFSYAGQTSSSVEYDLTPYKLYSTSSTVGASGVTDVLLNYENSALINSSNPLTVTVFGYGASNAPLTEVTVFTASQEGNTLPINIHNVTSVQLDRALPGNLRINVENINGNTVTILATLANESAGILLPPSAGKVWDRFSQVTNVTYNQQNGNPTSVFALYGSGSHFTYALSEYPASGTSLTDQVEFGITNFTFANNATYLSSQGATVNAGVGFRTERGSEITAISPSTVTIKLAKQVGTLVFKVHS